MPRHLLFAAAGLAITATPAHAAWQVARSRHFVVYSDDRSSEVAAFAARLERFDKAIRVVLKLPDPAVGPSARVTIFVVPSTEDIRRIAGTDRAELYRSQSPAGAWAFFPRRSPNDQSRRTPSPLMVLQHAYTHRVLFGGWPDTRMPAWLSEGFAEFFATTKVSADGGVVLGALPEYRWDGIDRASVVPIERLVRDGPDYANREEAHVFVGRAWLLIDYLTFDTDRSKQLSAYVAAVRSGKPADEAAAILGANAALDIKLNTYGTRPIWPSAALGPDKVPIEAIATRALTAGEAAVMPTVMRSRNGAGAAGASDVLEQTRILAAPFADDAGAQNALAQAAYDAGDLELAVAAADRAIAADPQSVDAMILKGRALVALAIRSKPKDQATWAAARSWFISANKADPLYFYPVQLFYDSFRAAHQIPTPAARRALLYAYTLNPTNVSLRLEAARVLLRDGDVDAARVALNATAVNEYGGALGSLAARALRALDTSGPVAAITVLETMAVPPNAAGQ